MLEKVTWMKCPTGYFFDSSLDEPKCMLEESVFSCDDFEVSTPLPAFLQHQFNVTANQQGKIYGIYL